MPASHCHPSPSDLKQRWAVLALFLCLAGAVGCAGGGRAGGAGDGGAASGGGGGGLVAASAAYEAGDFAGAYRAAAPLADDRGPTGAEAAYLAGLCARRLNRDAAAERHLRRATQARDATLAGDAGAALGLLYSEQSRYASAVHALESAAPLLAGEDRAQAYYYLAAAQQKLGRAAEARTHFRLARKTTQDDALRDEIDRQMAATGWTVQTGAYRDADNARQAARELGARVRGAAPRLVTADDGRGGTLHLVQIGTFTTHDSARRFAAQLGRDAVIVPIQR